MACDKWHAASITTPAERTGTPSPICRGDAHTGII
jgi:hypothetical protein